MGNDAVAMSQEECCKTVRSSVTVKEVETSVRWRDELRHQPGPGGPISQPGKWDQYPNARKTGPLPLCLSLDTSQVNVETTRHVADKSWHGEEGEPKKGNRVTRHVMRHPCIKNPPGGPKVSRGTRNTNKNNKRKI